MKKEMIAIAVAALVLVGLIIAFGIGTGETKIKTQKVTEQNMPREIEAEILPEYRELERALACRIDDEIYIIVTRGEKPTSGFEVEIEKVSLEKKGDKSNLVVRAVFADPEKPENMAQVPSYPYAVVKGEMKGLPDTIELLAEYAK